MRRLHGRHNRSLLIMLLGGLLLALAACARGPAVPGETPPPAAPGETPPSPAPGETPPSPALGGTPTGAAPPGASVEPPGPASPVTWTITHTASGLATPGGSLHLAGPYRFEVDFSAPVDQASVEAALRRNLGPAGTLEFYKWSSDRRLVLAVEGLAPGGEQVAIDPTGGQDAEGRRLEVQLGRFHAAGFWFWPTEPTAVLTLDPATGASAVLARHPQPYQTVSLSPDGRRALLRQHILWPGQSVGWTGTAHAFDLETGQVEDLDQGGLFKGEWSRDGGLLVDSGAVTWLPPGPLAAGRGGTRRLLYASTGDEYVASAHLSPDGAVAAVFAGRRDSPLDLHFFDLAPDRTGRLIRTIPAAAGVTQGPSGLTRVPAAWAPDGSALAYGDGGVRREEREPMQVWLAAPSEGEPALLAEEALDVGPWSPQADRLVLAGVGVVDRQGHVLLATHSEGPAAWSPGGTQLYLAGTVYDAATWKVQWTERHGGKAIWSPDGRHVAVEGLPGGGLFRADGSRVLEGLAWGGAAPDPVFSPDGARVYIPNPHRVVDLATGRATAVAFPPGVRGLGEYDPAGFTAAGHLLLVLGAG